VKPYAFQGNPLFIPEAHYAGDAVASANAFYAIGELDAIGFSPFSIENLPEGDPLISAYAVLDSLAPLIHAQRGKDTMRGLRAPINYDGVIDTTPQVFEMGGYRFTAAFIDPWTAKDKQNPNAHGALIIQTGKDEFIVAGSGVTLTFASEARVGMEQVIEGRFEDGVFVPGKWLNGDQTHQGRHLRLPPDKWGVQKLKLYKYN
jgi:beta-galactosidase GanA